MSASRPPCDEGEIRSGSSSGSGSGAPCAPGSERWVLAATILASGMAFIDGTIVNVALPALQNGLGATAADAQWIVESYALMLAALILVGGSLGDHFGRRRVFVAGVALFAAASVWCGLSRSPDELTLARAVQGVGGALLVPGSLSILGASFSEEQRGKAIGTWSGFSGVTAALGPVLGGFLIEQVSWRAAFLINVPLAVAVIVIASRHVPESRDPDAARLDLSGAALATLGLGGIVYGLIKSSSAGFVNLQVLSALVAGVAALAGFAALERRKRNPMMPPALFRSRNFSGANILTLFLYAGLGGALYYLPFNLIQVHGYSATAAGSAFLPFIALTFLLSRWAGGLVTRYGPRLPLVVGPVITAAGFGLLALPGAGDSSYWRWFFPAVAVLGLGMSFVIAPLTTTALSSVSGSHSGLASGVNNAVSRTATLLAIALLGIFVFAAFSASLDTRTSSLDLAPGERAALDQQKSDLGAAEAPPGVSQRTAGKIDAAIEKSFVTGFRVAMAASALLALVSALCAGIILEPRLRPDRPDSRGRRPEPASETG